MGGCATKLRQAFEAEDKGEKPEPPIEDDKKAAEDTEEQLKERVKEIVGEDENVSENEIAVVDEIQGCKQRPSLSLLFKQEEVKEWAESEKPKNEAKGKQEPILEAQELEPTRPKEEDQHQHPDHQEPILEAQEPEPTRPKEEDQHQHPDHDDHEQGKVIKEEQRNASERTKSEDVVASSAP